MRRHVKMKRSVLISSLATAAVICYGLFCVAGGISSTPNYRFEDQSTSARIDNVLSTSKSRFDVLILSYMRSGSTITGHLLGHRKDVFYFYEPFLADMTHFYFKGEDTVCQNLNPICRQQKGAVHKALNLLREIYSCSFSNSDTMMRMFSNTNSDFTARRSGQRWNAFIECKHRHRNNSYHDCVKRLVSTCRDAQHRVTKVLRLPLDSAEVLLRENPKLKVVYLLRDPRGVITSQIKAKWFPFTGKTQQSVRNNAETLCSRMSNDIEAAKRLTKMYPNRVKRILYEDFGDKVGLAKQLYDFAGMDFNETFIEVFAKTTDTSAATTETDGFHPFTYRYFLPWDTVKTIDSACTKVYNEIGYRNFKT